MRISTPRGHGTGFLFAQNTRVWGIATAAHVIRHEHAWELPIRIEHLESKTSFFLRNANRAIIISEDSDSAAIVISRGTSPFPKNLLPIIDPGKYIRVGFEIGWAGYPGLRGLGMDDQLCFFSGRVSCWLEKQFNYLVDGVAIHGVSGGPAFKLLQGKIVGIVTSYVANVAQGQSLPGVSCVCDIAALQSVVEAFKDLDQAQAQQTPPAGQQTVPPIQQTSPPVPDVKPPAQEGKPSV